MKQSTTKTTEFVSRRRTSEPAEAPDRPKRLIVNSAICAVLALGILGLTAMDTDFTDTLANGIRAAAKSELILDEDLGRIEFVSMPVSEGEVVETFSDSGTGVKIGGEESAAVMAVLPGVVAETGADRIVVRNDNGTRSTYTGIVPSVSTGDRIKQHEVIGKLCGEALALQTVGATGYLDSLSSYDLTETMQ